MNLVPKRTNETQGTEGTMEHNTSSIDKHARHTTQNFLKKFWVVLVLTIPILLYSEIVEKVFGFLAPDFFGRPFVILAFGSLVFFYGGWVFLEGAYRELRARLPGMMILIALAIISAYSFSVFEIVRGAPHNLLWELSTLIAVMLLGHWIEMRAVKNAQGALKELAKLLPDTAEVVRGETTQIVSLGDMREGDIVLVRPGSKIPADGKIIEGRSEINEAIITGESKLIHKKIGSEVIAGSLNGDGALKVVVTKIGDKTFLAGVMRLVADAEASKSRLQLLSDRAAFYLTILAVVVGGATFSFWFFADEGIVFAVSRLVAVLVITCPHALGLAIPLVSSISTTMAAKNGFLIRKRIALEMARKINVVLFDKTGTLTEGKFGIDEIIKNGDVNSDVLQIAASLDAHSEHSLAKAIVREAQKKNLELKEVNNFTRLAGVGAEGVIEGKEVLIGNEILLAQKNIELSDEYKARINKLSQQGKTIVHLIRDGKLLGSIALVDVIREESREAIKSLKDLGVKVAMVTGDSGDVAKWVAGELGLDEYFAKVLPQEKSEKVKLLQSEGYKVAMVGDGVNDAPALTQADLGIAIGAGTNVAIESAGIILVRNDPREISRIIKLSK
ncbi:MAG: heavy metal translocating P-type ATPase [Candidatus Yonathbacteria bacterium]|nr:heavy metal translocating P-type ATPase [Candidatus Yonathbacteria bacterium]